MKNSIICILFAFTILFSSSHHGECKSGNEAKNRSAEINDELLNELSRDIAELNLMIENIKEKYWNVESKYEIIEKWKKPETPDKKYYILKKNEEKAYDILAESKIKVPHASGDKVIDVFKVKDGDKKFIIAFNPNWTGVPMMALTDEVKSGGYHIKFSSPDISHDIKAKKSIKDYVWLTGKIEEATDFILKRLKEIKEKYENSPLYIEGFTIDLPILSVQIQFKFK